MKDHPLENIKSYPVIARFFSPDNLIFSRSINGNFYIFAALFANLDV